MPSFSYSLLLEMKLYVKNSGWVQEIKKADRGKIQPPVEKIP